MADYGVQVWDDDGKLILTSDHLLHRLWHTVEINSPTGQVFPSPIVYPTPLAHQPTIVQYGVDGFGFHWNHRMSGSSYVGLDLEKVRPFQWGAPAQASRAIFLIFARR